ncbi:MAG: hypothetical protein KF681_09880 [Bdellovibrionaceae bacterium]|nr:hypothetical protein [Pseudobdellovibrionaceae bacterium]
MKMSALSVLLLLFCGPAWAAPAGGSEFKSFRTREIDFYGQTRYYQAQGNFTKGGNSYDSLTSGYGYEIFNFDVGARAVLHSKWAAFAQATMANATSKSPTNTRTNSNLSEAQAGLDFLLNEGTITLIPEFSISFPFEDNSVTKDVVALSDGVMTVNGRAIALMRTRVINLGAYLGYTYREKGLSSLLPYGILGEFPLGSFTLGADLRGYASLSSDSTSDTEITRDFYQCRTNGCAKRYYAMNPSLLESSAYFKWAVSRTWDVSAGFTMAITGQSTATGYGAFANIGYRWGLPAAPTPMEDSETLPAGRARVVNPGFQEETNDGVDQNLFKAPTPPPSPDAQRKKRQRQIQDDLNKTEMQIELKSNRKKRSRP